MVCATFFSAQLMAQTVSENNAAPSATASKTEATKVTLSQEAPVPVKGTPAPDEKAMIPAAKTKPVVKDDVANKANQPVLISKENPPTPVPVKAVEN